MSTEYGWLIENGKQAGDGLAYRFIDNDAGGMPAWTEDHNKALRFARRTVPIRPKSVSALLRAVRFARSHPHAEFRVPGEFSLDSDDVLRMWERGVMARCNRGLKIAEDNFDLEWDARRVNDWARGIRPSGSGMLRTVRMQRRYPHVHRPERTE